jgi:predicted negative regulator of RcsB-dependent stress response
MLEDISGEQIKEQFKSNSKVRLITMIVGGLIVLVLGYFLYRQFIWKPANEKSKETYWAGLNYASKDSTALAIEELKIQVNKYDGKIGGEVAQFVYARQLMSEGSFEAALKELKGVDVSDTYVAIMASGLQADCLSEMGDYEKAYTSYMKAANMADNEYTTPMYLMKAGLCAEETKNFDKATEAYEKIRDDYTGFASQKSIEKYIARAKNKTTK